MSEWSQGALRRSKERQDAKQIKDQKALQDRGVLTDYGNVRWSELLSNLRNMCKEFNGEPGQRGTLIFNETGEKPAVSCQYGSGKIVCERGQDKIQLTGEGGLSYNEVLTLKLTPDGLDVWLSDSNKQSVQLEHIADNVITAVLAGCGR